jgi:hypothetical protein
LESQNKIGNRRNNADLERKHRGAVPQSELKDLSPREEQEKRFRKFQEASSRLLFAIKEVRTAAREIEENDGSCLWIDKGGAVFGGARGIADLIGIALRDAGYEKNLNSIDQNSPVAVIGAEVINVAYDMKIRPSGFATAMRNRNRAKKPEVDFSRRYPEVGRIKIL